MGKRTKWLAAGLTGLGAATVAGGTFGSGFQLRENSAAALGNAFAGAAASTEDASIVANNPAGMTALRGNQVSGDLAIVIPSAVFSGMSFNAAHQPIGGTMAATQARPSRCLRFTASMTLRPM